MKTITIPKNLIKNDDLVVIPRKKYEELLHAFENKKFDLDIEFEKALKDYKADRYYGPFKTAKEGIRFLKSRRKIKSKA